MNRIKKVWRNIVYRIKMKRAVKLRTPIKTAQELRDTDAELLKINAEYRGKL